MRMFSCTTCTYLDIFMFSRFVRIKKIFYKNKVNYSKLLVTIVQASDLRQEIDVLSETLHPNHSTTISFDAESMYPSIKYELVEKAVEFFSADLSIDASTTIKKCLEMIKFAMSSNILTFRGSIMNTIEKYQ